MGGEKLVNIEILFFNKIKYLNNIIYLYLYITILIILNK